MVLVQRISSLLLFSLFLFTTVLFAQSKTQWRIHSEARPLPAVVDPGEPGVQKKAGIAPSDAVVLFDGKNISAWQKFDGSPAVWHVKNGYMEVSKGGGSIMSRQAFGDCQLHVEWMVPADYQGSGQDGGNSGVYLMNTYEVQVLNSHQNETYADGQAAALYGQFPPLVNSSRPKGQWQSYDIIFHRPRFAENEELLSPAYITVLHNGIVVQNHQALKGPTEWQEQPPYRMHPDKLPISLQDHGAPIRFRNIWVRELEEGNKRKTVYFPVAKRGEYFGQYERSPNSYFTIKPKNEQFALYIGDTFKYYIFPESDTHFYSKKVNSEIEFKKDVNGRITGLTMKMGGGTYKAKKVD